MSDPARQVRDWLTTYDAPTSAVGSLLCDRHPADAIAVTEISPDLHSRDLTFGELAQRSAALAAGMADLGVGAGDHVATLMGKGIDLTVTALAIWRLGAVHVPLFTAFAPSAIAFRLTHSGTRLVVCDADQRTKLDPGDDIPAEPSWEIATTAPKPQRPGDHTLESLARSASAARSPAPVATGGDAPFILVYTSGAAGPARGVPVPVRALAAFHTYHHYGLDVCAEDVFWNTADPAWTYGLYYGLVSPLLAGHRSLQLRAGFDPELTLDVLATFGVTNFAAAPTVYRTLRATVKTMPPGVDIRRLSSAGEQVSPDVVEWARDAFGVGVLDHYGQPELGICAGDQPGGAGGAGRPLPGWSVTVLEPAGDEEAPPGTVGRVAVDIKDSPLMWFGGYRDSADATAMRFSPDGRWYLTGDTAFRDRDGHLVFSARDEEAILSSGFRIGPYDVEAALLHHPAVAETAVYGVPDELRGQAVAASVVLREGVAPGDDLAEELRETVRSRFGAHAYPRQVTFVAQLPRSPSGKIRRSRLRDV
ncbi:acetyl-CoA synthetase [Lipingzhangella halophila]|uniref:Acetyl-CoA synthetase n=1 Tax=Lipingzhangella halophila TaxID=1783352 RepID=A0A7W7RI19_9ACTN|nr:AMP-binding protein [Lipingzhangella halophila]MBB4931973.1 acetyl-CoA synthetase [Lipingzhangella halophila]